MKARVPWLLAGAGTVIVAAGVAGGGQAPRSFEGNWVLTSISPQRAAYDQFWLGTEARVTQTETTLVITRVSPPPEREARLTFGAESHNEYVVNGQKLVRDSRATLSRDTLLISTDTMSADGQRWLSNILRWSLDTDGTLVVGDTEICGKGECPSVVTTLKFKRKANGTERATKARAEWSELVGVQGTPTIQEKANGTERATKARAPTLSAASARADRPPTGCVFARQ